MMIYESPNTTKLLTKDEVARSAVQAGCDKFVFENSIYQIDFSYREVQRIEMTEHEAARQFGDK